MGIRVKINGDPYELPCCYQELTTRQFVRLYREWDMDKDLTERDYLKLFCILADVEFTAMHPSPENEEAIWRCVHWVVDEDFKFSKTPPKVLLVGDKAISIPEDPGLLSIGANIHLRRAIEGTRFLEESIATAAAIYLQPAYHQGTFDATKVKELENILLEMPAYLIYPLGFFLLIRASRYGSKPVSVLSRITTSLTRRLKKMRRAWRNPGGLSLTTIFH